MSATNWQGAAAAKPAEPVTAPIPRKARAGDTREQRYIQSALEQESSAVRHEQESNRNNRLNAAAFSLGQLVPHLLSEDEVTAELYQAARAAGLGDSESRKTIASGMRKGMLEPRDVPPPQLTSPPRAVEWQPRDEDAPDAPPSSVEPKTDPSAWPELDAAHIFSPLEPIRYLLAGLDLCAGAPALVAGQGFTGKTLVFQSAALGITTGQPVWGAFAARKGRVLHVDYEQGEWLTRNRYQRLAAGMMLSPADIGDALRLVSMPRVYLDSGYAETFLLEKCAGFDLMIVDSLRAACPSMEENDSSARLTLDMLNRVSDKTKCCVVVLHHARKPQQNAAGGPRASIRGSGALFEACGSVLVLEAEKGQPVRVSHEKARVSGRPAEDFLLRIDDVEIDGNPRAGLVVTAELGQAPRRSPVAKYEEQAQKVLAIVAAKPGCSKRHVRMQSGIMASRADDVLAVLLEEGRLENRGTDCAAKYHLPEVRK